MDDDLWVDLTQHGAFYDKDPPKWLTDQATKQGIHMMLELEHCMEESERLDHEQGAMYRWLQQLQQLHLASGLSLAQGECSKALCYWVLMTGNLGNSPLLYQVQQ